MIKELNIKISKIKLKFILFKNISMLNHLKNKKEKGGRLAILKIINKFKNKINLFLFKIELKLILKKLIKNIIKPIMME